MPDTPQSTEADRKTALRKAYTEATSALREKHQQEFNSLYEQKAKDKGVEWSPKPTAEERARQEMEGLMKAHPELAAEFAERVLAAQRPKDSGAGSNVT